MFGQFLLVNIFSRSPNANKNQGLVDVVLGKSWIHSTNCNLDWTSWMIHNVGKLYNHNKSECCTIPIFSQDGDYPRA